MSDTSNNINTDKLFSNMPAYNLLLPIVNQFCCKCIGCWFHTLAKTITDKTPLIKIATVDTHPVTLPFVAGTKKLTTNASKGISTAASAQQMVNEF